MSFKPINCDHMGRIRQMLAAGTVVERCGADGIWRRYRGNPSRIEPLDDIDLTTYIYRYRVPPENTCPYECNDATLRELRKLVAHTGADPFGHLSGLLSQLSNIVACYKADLEAASSVSQHQQLRLALVEIVRLCGGAASGDVSDAFLTGAPREVSALLINKNNRITALECELGNLRAVAGQIAYLADSFKTPTAGTPPAQPAAPAAGG